MARYLHPIFVVFGGFLLCVHKVAGFATCHNPEGLSMTFQHGEIWQKSTDNCLTCTCNSGSVSCSPKTCTADDRLPCSNPRKANDMACCKTCDGQKVAVTKDKKMKKVCFKDIRKNHRKKQKRKRGRGRKGRSRRDASVHKHRHGHGDPLTAAAPMPPVLESRPFHDNRTRIPRFLRHMCVPKRADHLIYRHIEGKEMFVAFDNAKKDEVELWTWHIKKTACESLTTPRPDRCRGGSQDIHINMTSFQKLIHKDTKVFRKQMTKAMVFGASNKKQVENFKVKLYDIMTCGNKKKKCLNKGKSPEECANVECTHRVVMVMRAFYKDIRLFPVNFNCNKCKNIKT